MVRIFILDMSVVVVTSCASNVSEWSSFAFILKQDEYVFIHGIASLEFKWWQSSDTDGRRYYIFRWRSMVNICQWNLVVDGQKLVLNEWKGVLYISYRAVKLLFRAVICGYYG